MTNQIADLRISDIQEKIADSFGDIYGMEPRIETRIEVIAQIIVEDKEVGIRNVISSAEPPDAICWRAMQMMRAGEKPAFRHALKDHRLKSLIGAAQDVVRTATAEWGGSMDVDAEAFNRMSDALAVLLKETGDE